MFQHSSIHGLVGIVVYLHLVHLRDQNGVLHLANIVWAHTDNVRTLATMGSKYGCLLAVFAIAKQIKSNSLTSLLIDYLTGFILVHPQYRDYRSRQGIAQVVLTHVVM